ncbi:MAG: hypothetical protein KDD25_10000, partial [Bdellovibrionales bacterium]|nr:hypothetical protein [Bdellovibrionales bacterium]
MKGFLNVLLTVSFAGLAANAAEVQSLTANPQAFDSLYGQESLTGSDYGLKKIKEVKTSDGLLIRYQQTYKGIPVDGYHVIRKISSDNSTNLRGDLVSGLEADLAKGVAHESLVEDYLAKAQSAHLSQAVAKTGWDYSNIRNERSIYIDEAGKAHVAQIVSFFAENLTKGEPSRPVFVYDVATGKLLKSYNALSHEKAHGPGGNEKTGKYFYDGVQHPELNVKIDATGKCAMDAEHVETHNMNHSYWDSKIH